MAEGPRLALILSVNINILKINVLIDMQCIYFTTDGVSVLLSSQDIRSYFDPRKVYVGDKVLWDLFLLWALVWYQKVATEIVMLPELAWSNEQSLKKLLTKKRTNNNRSQPTHTCIHTFTHMVRYINRQIKREGEKKTFISLFLYKFVIYIFCLWNYPFAFLTQWSTYFLNLNYSLIHMKIEKKEKKRTKIINEITTS